MAGKPLVSRTVGVIMKHNPYSPIVPCHRVVGWDGSLVGYALGKGISDKRKILLSEDVSFKGKKVNLSLYQ